jgi:hypothetical protein
MPNPTEKHEQVASNIGARLKLAIERQGLSHPPGRANSAAVGSKKRALSP